MRKTSLFSCILGLSLFLSGCGNPQPNTVVVSQPQQQSGNVNVQVTSQAADGLNLQGFGDFLKSHPTPQALEEAINRPGSINNLDLDQDGNTDYIRVTEAGQGTARLFSLTAVLSGGQEQEVATINFEQLSPQVVNVQIQGNPQIYGPNVFYHSQYSVGDLLLFSYLYSPLWRPYVSPWHYGYYPGFYSVYRPVPFTTYRTQTRTYVERSTLRSAPSSQTRTVVRSPNADKVATNVRAPLRNPTVSQRSFQERDTSKAIGSGGFGRPNTASNPPASSYRAPSTTQSPQVRSQPSSSGFGSSRSTSPTTRAPSSSSSFGSKPPSSGFGGRRK